MAQLTTPTIRDVLQDLLKRDLGENFKEPLTELKCLMKTKNGNKHQCLLPLRRDIVSKVQMILEQRVTYLEGDRERIFASLNQLADLLVHPKIHGKAGREKVAELQKEYRQTMEQHLDANKPEASLASIHELIQKSGKSFAGEEECLPIVRAPEPEMTTTTEAEGPEVTYPALPITDTFGIEDMEDVIIDSSSEPQPLLQLDDTQSRSLTTTSTTPTRLSPVSNSLTSNPLFSLVLSILPQWLAGFISLVHFKWGTVPVRNKSGKIENRAVVDLGILLGMRITARMIPIVGFSILGGLYYTVWNTSGSLMS